MIQTFTEQQVKDLCTMIFMGAQEYGINVDTLLTAALNKVHYENKAAEDTPLTTAFKRAIQYGATEEMRWR